MCFGVPVLSGLMSAAGGLITRSEQEANAKRMADARNAELKRTLALNDPIAAKARGIFSDTAGTFAPDKAAQEQADATAARTSDLEATVKPASATETSLSGSTPSVIRTAYAKSLSDAMNKGVENARNLGKLGGYGDYWFGKGIDTAGAGRDVGVQQNFAAGNMALLPYSQDFAAQRAYKPISPIGAILAGLGRAAAGANGGGGFFAPKYTSPL